MKAHQKVEPSEFWARDFGLINPSPKWIERKRGSKVNLGITNSTERSFGKWAINEKQIAVLVIYIKQCFEKGITHFESIYDEIVKIEHAEKKHILPTDLNHEPITSYRLRKFVIDTRNGLHGDVVINSRYAGMREEIKNMWLSGMRDKKKIGEKLGITDRRVHVTLIGFGLVAKKKSPQKRINNGISK